MHKSLLTKDSVSTMILIPNNDTKGKNLEWDVIEIGKIVNLLENINEDIER